MKSHSGNEIAKHREINLTLWFWSQDLPLLYSVISIPLPAVQNELKQAIQTLSSHSFFFIKSYNGGSR